MTKNLFEVESEAQLETEFHISRYIIFYKLVLGIIELILGISIWIWGRRILTVYENFRNQGFFEDPHDLISRGLESIMPFISAHLTYLIFILILLGIVKIIGAIGLLKGQHWGLDLLVVVTILLLPFEFFNLLMHFSLSHISYFILNLLIALYLVNFKPHEYLRRIRNRYTWVNAKSKS